MTGTTTEFLAWAEAIVAGDHPYIWGGTGPYGYDCSGLVYADAAVQGVSIPRTSQDQRAASLVGEANLIAIPAGQEQPGDLIFFDVPGDGPPSDQPGHVAIYLNPSTMIEAPHTGEDVKYTSPIPNIPGVISIMGYARITGLGTTPSPTPPPVAPTEIIKPVTGRYGLLNKPGVVIVPTWTGKGYTEVAADGGTFNFGDAVYLGSLAGKPLNAPIVGACRTPPSSKDGLYLVGTDGGVFCFGAALFKGSVPGVLKPGEKLAAPCISIAVTQDNTGYWIMGADGGVFCFGGATFFGSAA